MILSHDELKEIYNNVFDEKVKDGIDKFIKQDLDNPDFKYSTECLWETDFLIGGIGGYCMPANPVKNPFPAGIKRALYRPLQYVRSNIDICDVRMQARYTIESAGMHLEAVCRLYLKESCQIGKFRFYSATLGKMVYKIEQVGNFDENIINALYNFVAVYNKSKHEINQDETRERMFNACDAIVAYFAVRVLGIYILQRLSIIESFQKYKINND